MEILNQILVQLSEANRLATAQNPHCRRLALVLLDNIVELQIRRKAESVFVFDNTTWYHGPREHSFKVRREVFRNHAKLVSFAAEQSWISKSDLLLLTYAHRVRNVAYHEGELDRIDGEIAINLLCSFIRDKFPIWKTTRWFLRMSSNTPVAIDRAAEDSSGEALLTIDASNTKNGDRPHLDAVNTDAYWKESIDHVLSRTCSGDIRALIRDRISAYLADIEESIEYIEHDSCRINLFEVISYRMTILTPAFSRAVFEGKSTNSYNVALNIYSAIIPEEERLLDIPDASQRAIECHRLLDSHTFHRKFLPKERLRSYRIRSQRIPVLSEVDGIDLFLRIENDLQKKRVVINEFSRDLSGYIDFLNDVARGK